MKVVPGMLIKNAHAQAWTSTCVDDLSTMGEFREDVPSLVISVGTFDRKGNQIKNPAVRARDGELLNGIRWVFVLQGTVMGWTTILSTTEVLSPAY